MRFLNFVMIWRMELNKCLFSSYFYLWKRLFTDTESVNKVHLTDTVPVNNMHLTDTVSVNKVHLTDTVSVNKMPSQIQYHLPFFGQNIFPIESIFSISFEILKINPLYLTLHSSLKLFWVPNNLIIASIMDFSVVNYLAPWWIGLRVPSRWWGRAPCITQLALVWLWR